MGVSTLDVETRQRRAEVLVRQLFHSVGPSVVESARPSFQLAETPAYHPLTTTVGANDTVRVRGWVQRPPGMRHVYTYRRLEYRMAPDAHIRTEEIEAFTVEGEARPDS